jgi:integrase/recombinase XerD
MAYPEDGQPNLRQGVLTDGRRNPAPRYDPALPISELFEEFLDLSAGIINEGTTALYRYDYAMFAGFLAERQLPATLGTIEERTLVEYIAWLQRRPKKRGKGALSSHSVNHYLRPIRTFIRWLVDHGFYTHDPLAGGRRGLMPKLGVRMLKSATIRDVDRLLDGSKPGGRSRIERAVRDRDAFIILLAADTGLRTEDVCRAQIGHLDLDQGSLFIPAKKGDRHRLVPLSREVVGKARSYLRTARPYLAAMPETAFASADPLILSSRGEALTSNGLYQAMCRVWKRGGGTGGFGLHRLRHLFGTEAAEGGMHPSISQKIMGHADEKSQRVYQHPSDAAVADAHSKITPIRKLSPRRRRSIA